MARSQPNLKIAEQYERHMARCVCGRGNPCGEARRLASQLGYSFMPPHVLEELGALHERERRNNGR